MYRNGRLVVNEEEAERVKDIFNMWAAGIHYKEISQKFNVPVSSLYEVIKNPTYIGKIRYRDKLYDGAHKGIIDEELFMRINNVDSKWQEKS
ncbi:recombinase family protein [Candidatus Woesearchaeota archaeon]|nr:recombinase family protein [Candidatus Woesearchaeota archaeon]